MVIPSYTLFVFKIGVGRLVLQHSYDTYKLMRSALRTCGSRPLLTPVSRFPPILSQQAYPPTL